MDECVKLNDERNRPYHTAANLFPLLEGDDFETLKLSIGEDGQQQPIVVDSNGAILDGRNRHRACVALGIEPRLTLWNGEGSAAKYVVNANLARYHYTASQRAVFALEILPMLEAEARERYAATVGRPNKSEGKKSQTNGHTRIPQSRDYAAQIVHVSPRYVQAAKHIQNKKPSEIASLRSGEKTISEVLNPKPHVARNTGDNEWYTPEAIINAARIALGGHIDLDPASSEAANAVVQASRYYTIANDGLSQHWQGRIWLNPPYASDKIARFVAKFIKHAENGDLEAGIILVNNATETAWGQSLLKASDCVFFPGSRVRFWQQGSDGLLSPLQGQMMAYIGGKAEKFIDAMRPIGGVFLNVIRW